MKRRSLLSGSFWSSVLAYLAPMGVTSATSSTQTQTRPEDKKDGVISPYDAVEAVYNSFRPIGSSSELVLEDRWCWLGKPDVKQSQLRCKLVERGTRFHSWLCYYDSINDLSSRDVQCIIRNRELHIVRVPVDHEGNTSAEGGVEGHLNRSWSLNGAAIVSVSKYGYPDTKEYRIQTGPLFRTQNLKKEDPTVTVLARFLTLLTS